MPRGTPLYTLGALFIIVTAAVVLLISGVRNENLGVFVAVLATSVPSLIAAFSSERSSRDIRNGMVTEKAREGATEALNDTGADKAREGATEALNETGVTAAVSGNRVAHPATLHALSQILDRLPVEVRTSIIPNDDEKG